MSTFSTKGGLYERAQKRFNVPNGKKLFTYSFYEKRKLEALVCFMHDQKLDPCVPAYMSHSCACVRCGPGLAGLYAIAHTVLFSILYL